MSNFTAQRRRAGALALIIAALSAPALAQEAAAVSPLIVSANPSPTPQSEVASSVTLITAGDIDERQALSVPDAIANVPGLDLVQTGGEGGVTGVFIRGANSNHTKVLLDGMDIGDPTSPDGAFDFGGLLTTGLARIEVLRGPQSGLYGSDAIGGVVAMESKAGAGPPHIGVVVQGGSFATLDEAASAGGGRGDLSWRFDLDHLRAGATPVTPLDVLPPGEARRADAYDNLTAGTKLGLAIGGGLNLALVARFVASDLRFTGDDNFGFFPDPVQSEDRSRELFARASASGKFGPLSQTVGLAYVFYHREGFTPGFAPTLDTGDRIAIDWRGDIALAAGELLSLKVEHRREAIEGSPIFAAMTTDAGSASLQSALGGRLFDTLSLRYDANDRFGGAFTWRIAPAWLIAATGTKLHASVGAGFKAPTLNELFVSFPQFGFFANPHLAPEHSLGWDAGFDQALVGGPVSFGATAFDNSIRDLVAENPTFTGLINIGRARTWGVEAYAGWRPSDRLLFRADYTYDAAIDAVAHRELLRRPNNKASLAAQWRATPALSLTATGRIVGSWVDGNRDFSIPRLKAPGYATADLAGARTLRSGVTLFARATNLFDRRYEDPFGFRRPGRGVFAGVRLGGDR